MSSIKTDLYFVVEGISTRERKDKDGNIVGVYTQLQTYFNKNGLEEKATIALPEVLSEKEQDAIFENLIYLNDTDNNLEVFDKADTVFKASNYKVLTDAEITKLGFEVEGMLLNRNIDLLITGIADKPNKEEPSKSKVVLQSRIKENREVKIMNISVKEHSFKDLMALKGKTVNVSNIKVFKMDGDKKKGTLGKTYYSTLTIPKVIK